MNVTLMKHPTESDWMFAKRCTLVTVSKTAATPPSEEWKRKLLRSMHSPIRVLEFAFLLTDVPYWVSVHLCRHVHAQPFVSTQRNDRQSNYDRRKAPQDSPVDMIWVMNAEELINIAHKRLCSKASPETREAVKRICGLVEQSNPEFKGLLVPMCEYRGGKCDEFEPCGRYKEADSTHVVRCKDCTSYLKPIGICQLYSTDGCHFIKKETDFCSCAERRIDEGEMR